MAFVLSVKFRFVASRLLARTDHAVKLDDTSTRYGWPGTDSHVSATVSLLLAIESGGTAGVRIAKKHDHRQMVGGGVIVVFNGGGGLVSRSVRKTWLPAMFENSNPHGRM